MTEIDHRLEASRMSERIRRVADEARERLAVFGPVEGTAKSSDGGIEVTVSPGGALSEIKISEYALRSGPDTIAREILELADRATRDAGDTMYHAMAPVLGRRGAAKLKSLGYEPLPEDDD